MPIRPWVLSLPWELGWLAAGAAAGAACGIACARSPGAKGRRRAEELPQNQRDERSSWTWGGLAKKKFSAVLTFGAGLS